jgi:hypothetical protein
MRWARNVARLGQINAYNIFVGKNWRKNTILRTSRETEKIVLKVKLSLCFNWAPRHEDVLGSGGTELHSFFDLGIRLSWVVSFTPRPLYPQGKSPWYPLDRRLGGPQSRSGCGGGEKNSQLPPGIEPQNHDRPARGPVLYRLSYHGCGKIILEWILGKYGGKAWTGCIWLRIGIRLT